MLTKLTHTMGLCVLFCACIFAQEGQTINSNTTLTTNIINAVGEGRYTAVEPLQVETWAVFGTQAQYKSEEQFNGFAQTTAAALGLTTGYNEMPGNRAPAVTLNPNEPVTYNGSEYWLSNCKIGGKPYKNRFKPINPPSASAPPPTQIIVIDRPCQTCAAPAPLPVCNLTGSYADGFFGLSTNGTGKFSVNGEDMEAGVVDNMDFLGIKDGPVGTHTVLYTVTGPLGTTSCQAKFDIFGGVSLTGFVSVVKIPKIGFCDTEHDGWRPDHMLLGMVEKVVCTPGHFILDTAAGGAAGFGLSRISHGATRVLIKPVPPGGTVSPK